MNIGYYCHKCSFYMSKMWCPVCQNENSWTEIGCKLREEDVRRIVREEIAKSQGAI